MLCFEAISGLKINFFKSELLGIRVENPSLVRFAEILGCKVGSFPVSYLGLPLCPGHINKSVKNLVVIERIENKLSSWKASYLSLRGRVTLIKSSLSNLPIYFLSVFKCPASVASRKEKLQREFLWQGENPEKKFHLVDWASICLPKTDGGLGIRPIKVMNQALLGANGYGD